MTLLYNDDKVHNFQRNLKASDNKKLQKLSKADIKELLKIEAKTMADLLEAAPAHGYTTISLGYGVIKLYYRDSTPYKDLKTGKMKMSPSAPLYYFKPSPDTKQRVKDAYRKELLKGEN